MKKSFPALVVSLAFLVILGSGCAMSDLKNTNRRLKEANDRLVSENNRMEQELAAAEKDVSEKAKKIDELQMELEKGKSIPDVPEERPVAKGPIDDGLGLMDESGIQTFQTPRGIMLRMDEKVLFSLGQATLSAKGQAILKRIAQKLNTRYRSNMIRVEGHTDDVPISKVKNKYPTNWELSSARACSVVRYLVDHGNVKPTRVYPAGFASYKPVAASKTANARSQNRRVEILILNEKI